MMTDTVDKAVEKVLARHEEELHPGQFKVDSAYGRPFSTTASLLSPKLAEYLTLKKEIAELDGQIHEEQAKQRPLLIAHDLLREPIVDQWLKMPEPYPLKRPEHVLAERMMTMAMLMAAKVEYQTDRVEPVSGFDFEERQALMREILKAPPYLWTSDVFATAMASPLPPHVISETSVPHAMWWSDSRKEQVLALDDDELSMVGMYVAPTPTHLRFFEFWVATRSPAASYSRLVVSEGWFAWGTHFPDGVHERDRNVVELLLKQLAFLASPYTAADAVEITPSVHRDYVHRKKVQPPKIRFVTLRRPQAKPSASDGAPQTRNWTRQWLVRAHYRAQWYPSLKAHKVIWIESFMKGPSDMPFVPPVYKVAR